METNELMTFKSLMDGEKHPLYFVCGSTVKVYMCVISSDVMPLTYYSRKPKIKITCFDKNGKNTVWTWGGPKIVWFDLTVSDLTSHKYYNGNDYKNYFIFTTKDEAYRHCVKKLEERRRKINASILKCQREFGMFDSSKTHYSHAIALKK